MAMRASDKNEKTMAAILVALQEGTAGKDALQAWSLWAASVAKSNDQFPRTLWILCSSSAVEESVLAMPHVDPFFVGKETSWAGVLTRFMSHNEKVSTVGLLGEGTLPPSDLAESVESMHLELLTAEKPTAILTRSRSRDDEKDDADDDGAAFSWLPDKFVSQVWCNRALLEASRLTDAGLEELAVRDLTLLQVLSRLIRKDPQGRRRRSNGSASDGDGEGNNGRSSDISNSGPVLVDGTSVLQSIFVSPSTRSTAGGRHSSSSGSSSGGNSIELVVQGGNGKAATPVNSQRAAVSGSEAAIAGDNKEGGEGDVYIGGLELALVFDGGRSDEDESRRGENGVIRTSSIRKAPWPPTYVLETVATQGKGVVDGVTDTGSGAGGASKGMVLVTNINCGYVDMATNFWRSVQKSSGIKVLFVAMDEVSFDFMDALDPGSAALFPTFSSERKHSTKAGRIGGQGFAAEVLVRPFILTSILLQDFAVLWSDSDMVWIGNPLPLLPELGNPDAAEAMFQYDGNSGNKCTCFIFMRPTESCLDLMKLWEQNLIATSAKLNQPPLQRPLQTMRDAGLRVDIVPPEVMPAGKHFFDHDWEENYVQLYHEDTLIIHNNWIKGHADKKSRFERHHLWSVGDMAFPQCGNPVDDGVGWRMPFARFFFGAVRLSTLIGGCLALMFVGRRLLRQKRDAGRLAH